MSDETAPQDPTPLEDPAAADQEADAEAAPEGALEAELEEMLADPLSVEGLLATLEAVTAERDQHLNDLQRLSAEFANFRKQTEKRNAEFAARAGSRVAEALLPVLDACDAAVQQGVEGVEQIGSQMRGELERSGLQAITDLGEPFDPNRHEAAMSEPGDEGQEGPIVGQVLRTGYSWNGRVLRAAMVSVKG